MEGCKRIRILELGRFKQSKPLQSYWKCTTPTMSVKVTPTATFGFSDPSRGSPIITVSGLASGIPSGPAGF